MRTQTATKNRGKCESCGEEIVKGQRYSSGSRHAKEEEMRANLYASTHNQKKPYPTFHIKHRGGPQVSMRWHEDCPHPLEKP